MKRIITLKYEDEQVDVEVDERLNIKDLLELCALKRRWILPDEYYIRLHLKHYLEKPDNRLVDLEIESNELIEVIVKEDNE